MSFLLPQKLREKLSPAAPKAHEATDAEENEEFSLVADVFAPQHNKRVPRGTTSLTKRVPLTAADKKKVNKASIGLPIARTLKFFTFNCSPFILERSVPVEVFRRENLGQLINTGVNLGLNTFFGARQARTHSTPVVQQRHSLGGTTLYSIAHQPVLTAPLESVQDPADHQQNRQTSVDIALPVDSIPHVNNIRPEVAEKVNNWLQNVSTPTNTEPESSSLATQLEYSDFVSDLDIDEDIWELIERHSRQRKSPLRQDILAMSINDNAVRRGNSTRPSGSYSRSGENHNRTTLNAIKDHPSTSARRPKNMPSGSQLPSCWNDEMDEFICHMEAQCEFSTKSIAKALKQRFPELRDSVIQEEAIQRRIDTLDNQDNSYFVKGADIAVAQAEANGYEMPPFDHNNYPVIQWEVKPDHIVLGTSPGKEVVDAGYEYSLQPRVAGGIDINTIKIGPPTPKKTLPLRFRREANIRLQDAETLFNTNGLKGLTDNTDHIDALLSDEAKHDPGNDDGLVDITNTMSNARIAAYPRNDHTNGGILGNQVYITPRKSSKKGTSDANHETIRAMNNGSPTPTRALDRSGREKPISSSTTGTNILGFGREGFGRENSGGPTILERRRARQENRDLTLNYGAGELPRTP